MGERARSVLVATGAFLAAFIANSHHAIHMALLSLGIGVGFSAFLFNPLARRGMLLVSLVMTSLALVWLLRRPHRGAAETAGVVASVAASLGLIAYTVIAHGW